ncbi:uncharacterized protein si:dkey-20d21.12 [Osmerus mordax]|uniref:uncharacterized protein si:dkey-20d21.12 n=1 Tax=Osmerus mordax TaxID=8014 RepID=UPI00350EF869
MSQPASSPATPAFVRISDRDLTEIELHSVESINDLHRTHPEQYHNHKGIRRPPPLQIPSSNGIVCLPNSASANPKRGWGRLVDKLMPSSFRSGLACAVILFLLLTLILIFYFLVEQGASLRMLTEAVRERQDVAMEISQFIQELQALRHNLTAMTTMRP